MKQLLALLLFCISVGYIASAQQPSDIQTMLESGNKQLASKQYVDALKTFTDILKSSPSNVDALSGAVVAYTRLDRLKDAQDVVGNALKAKPDDASIIIINGKVYGLRYQYDNAIKEFEKALPLAADSLKSNIYSNISSMRNQMDDFESAKADARKAIALQDKNESAYINLGFAQYQLREYSDALDSYSMALTINSENPEAYFSRGMAYLKTNDKRNGCADFQRACKLGNKNGCIQYGMECAK